MLSTIAKLANYPFVVQLNLISHLGTFAFGDFKLPFQASLHSASFFMCLSFTSQPISQELASISKEQIDGFAK